MLRALTEKVGNRQEQMSNVKRELETLRNNKKRNARYKKHCKPKNAFDEIISILDTDK